MVLLEGSWTNMDLAAQTVARTSKNQLIQVELVIDSCMSWLESQVQHCIQEASAEC